MRDNNSEIVLASLLSFMLIMLLMLLITLKVQGTIGWPWFLIFAPGWFPLVLFLEVQLAKWRRGW